MTFASPVPVCTFGATSDPASATNYQDLWWKAPGGSESGWGINLAHQGNIIVATWFTYDARRSAAVAVGQPWSKRTGPTYAGTLIRSTGPAFSATPFDPRNVARTGSRGGGLTFAEGNSGTFSYTVNGVAQSKAITRQVFRAPGTVCR